MRLELAAGHELSPDTGMPLDTDALALPSVAIVAGLSPPVTAQVALRAGLSPPVTAQVALRAGLSPPVPSAGVALL